MEARGLEELVVRRLISRGRVIIRRRQVVKLASRLASGCSGAKLEDAVMAAEQRGLRLYGVDYVAYGERLGGNRMLLIPQSLEPRLPPHLFRRLVEDVAETVELYVAGTTTVSAAM